MTTPDPYPLHESVSTLLSTGTPAGTPSLVQSKNGLVGTLSASFTNPTTAGNTVIVAINGIGTTSGSPPSITGVTLGGAAGNFLSGAQDVSSFIGGFYALAAAWVDWNCAGGQTAIAVSGSNLVTADCSITIYEFAGLVNTGSPLDQISVGAALAGGTAWTSNTTPMTTAANEIWFGVGSTIAGINTQPASPWINLLNTNSNTLDSGYQFVTAKGTATYAGTQTAADAWAAVVITLKITPASGVNGAGTVKISPGLPASPGSGVGASRNSGLLWNVTGVAVSAQPLAGQSAPVAQAQASCYISYGIQSASPDDFQGQTQTGSTGDTCTVNATLKPGDWITVIWAGGDAGVKATARIFGTVTPPGMR